MRDRGGTAGRYVPRVRLSTVTTLHGPSKLGQDVAVHCISGYKYTNIQVHSPLLSACPLIVLRHIKIPTWGTLSQVLSLPLVSALGLPTPPTAPKTGDTKQEIRIITIPAACP